MGQVKPLHSSDVPCPTRKDSDSDSDSDVEVIEKPKQADTAQRGNMHIS